MSAVQELDVAAVWQRCAGTRRVAIGLLGYGRVGQAVAAVASRERDRLNALGFDVSVVAALARDSRKPRPVDGVRTLFEPDAFFSQPLDVIVDVMGGEEPAFTLVQRALTAGMPVVSANKTLIARRGGELASLSRCHGVPLAFDAAVLAGVPFLGALARRPLLGATDRITGIINGTSHFLLSALAAGVTFEDALADACARGYAEPDSSADISGRDALEKLTILLRLAGVPGITPSHITTLGIDVLRPEDFRAARQLDGTLKPIALASFERGRAGAWVGPALVDQAHPASRTTGVFNLVEFAGAASLPVTFAGPGAGPEITAATILDDVIDVATVGRPEPVRAPRPTSAEELRLPPFGAWYVRVAGGGMCIADVAEACAVHGLHATRIANTGEAIAVRTLASPWSRVSELADFFRSLDADVLALPVIGDARS